MRSDGSKTPETRMFARPAQNARRKNCMAKRLDAFLSDLLCSHSGDPANAPYLVPLHDAEAEALAHAMAVQFTARRPPTTSAKTSYKSKPIASISKL
jgi:hypothetical protein